MDGSYLFIDGAYFRAAYSDLMTRYFNSVPEIEWTKVSAVFGGPRRIYYYDAVDRNTVGAETPAERDARVERLDQFHARLNSLDRWHVREGFVSRGRRAARRSQKAVDVQLSVDALEHAVAHNMAQAIFILGDLDFEPLLFSLNRFGIQTLVYYERNSAAPELLEAADMRSEITLQTCSDLTPKTFLSGRTTFSEGIAEVIDARVWTGIHFRGSDVAGARVGRNVARFVFQHGFGHGRDRLTQGVGYPPWRHGGNARSMNILRAP